MGSASDVLLTDFGNSGEGVKAHDTPDVIERFVDRTQVRPGHQPRTEKDTALDDVAMNSQHALEEFILTEKRAEDLPGRKLGKAPELVHVRPKARVIVGFHPDFVFIINGGPAARIEHRI